MNPRQYLSAMEYFLHLQSKPLIQVDVRDRGQWAKLTLPRGSIAAIFQLALRMGADAGLGRSRLSERIRALGSRG